MKKAEGILIKLIGYVNSGCYFLFYFLLVFSAMQIANIDLKFDSGYYNFTKYLLSLEHRLDDRTEYLTSVESRKCMEADKSLSFQSEGLVFRENRGYLNFGSGLIETRESNLPELKCQAKFSFSFYQNDSTTLKSSRKTPASYFIACDFNKPEGQKSSILRI
jgi:hypothetical protein